VQQKRKASKEWRQAKQKTKGSFLNKKNIRTGKEKTVGGETSNFDQGRQPLLSGRKRKKQKNLTMRGREDPV